MTDHKITTEELHAMADGELSAEQQDRLLSALESDPQAQALLCDIRHTKNLLKHAYPLKEMTDSAHSYSNRRWIGQIAATLLLTLGGFGAGWYSATPAINDAQVIAQTKQILSAPTLPHKTIIYLGSSDQERFRATLNKAKQLLDSYSGSDTEVYIVASAGGIDLMRTSTSPYKDEMVSMLEANEALRFVACNNTIYRFRQEGKPVNLVAGTDVAPSAVEFVVSHIKQGWNYIAI